MAKRITTQDLHCEVEQVKKDIALIKDNHLAHLDIKVEGLKDEIKESRTFFQDRLDRLDNKIMWILGILLTTAFSAIVAMMAGVA